MLIDEDADRVNSYTVWNYVEGNDTYYISMHVDLTLPPDKVSDKEWRCKGHYRNLVGSYLYDIIEHSLTEFIK